MSRGAGSGSTSPAAGAGRPASAPPLLLVGGTVLTLDRRATVLAGTDLLLAGGRVAALGSNLTVPPGTRVLDVTDHWVLPGLIQGHVHLGQTGFRGLAEGRRLLPWLRERIWPLEAAHDDESAYWCALLGACECLLAGTTLIQDIGLGPGARGLLQAIAASGIRARAGKCLMDGGEGLPPALVEDTDDTLADTARLGDTFDGAGGGRLSYALNPRFILSASDELWRGLRDLAGRRGWPIHTHALEQREETAAVQRLKGKDEIEYFDEAGILSHRFSVAHGVWLTGEHHHRLRGRPFGVVHCPSSNLKLGSGVADLPGLARAGIPVGIGCDGAACSNHLDAFRELHLAALLQKLHHGPEALDGRAALRLATSDGARALGLGNELGHLETGTAADVVVLHPDRPELAAAAAVDPHDRIAFAATGACVRHVVVAGEVLVEDGRLTRFDLGQVLANARREIEKVVKRAGLDG